MIIKTHRIVFRADRSPMPEWLNIGYEGDNMVERLEVILPKISDRQRAYLMIGESEYANMVDMVADGDVRYHVDLTAELVGKAGAAQAYIAIDGDDGSTWHSGVFRLNTGDLPAVNEDIAEHYPDAVEKMREEISEHRDEMAEQTKVVADAANRAEDAAERAEHATPEVNPEAIAKAVEDYMTLHPVGLPTATADKLGAVRVGQNLLIDEAGVLSVDTANEAEQDNTRPITSAGVFATVGNINALLETI